MDRLRKQDQRGGDAWLSSGNQFGKHEEKPTTPIVVGTLKVGAIQGLSSLGRFLHPVKFHGMKKVNDDTARLADHFIMPAKIGPLLSCLSHGQAPPGIVTLHPGKPPMTVQPNRTRRKFVNYYEDAVQKLLASGITPDQMKSLRDFGLMARDSVTGFHEGRSGAGRFSTLRMAIQHVKETGEEAYYVEMDLKNLSGLNAVLGHSGANEIFAMIAALVRRALSAIASEVCFFRHGGDEMSAFLINATKGDLRTAFVRINREISILADEHDLVAIPHPKHEGDERYNGSGIYFGFCKIQPDHEDDPAEVFSTADQLVEGRKMRAVGNAPDGPWGETEH